MLSGFARFPCLIPESPAFQPGECVNRCALLAVKTMTFQKAKELELELEGPVATAIDPTEFDEFDDIDLEAEFEEADETKSIPFAQMCTTSVALTRYAAMPTHDFPFGLFIPAAQAEKAGFQPDDNWMIESPCMGGIVRKFSPTEGTPGYFVKPGKSARIVVLTQSQQEVYKDGVFNGKKAKVCLGNYLTGFDPDGQPVKSDAGLAFDSADKNTGWQNSQRYLFYVVGADNEPLSERPFTLRISNAFGIGFKSELKMNATEMVAASKAHSERNKAKAVAKATAVASGDVEGGITADKALKLEKRKAIRSLNRKEASRFVFCFQQSMRENKDGIGTVYVSGRMQPSIWQPGKKPNPSQIDRTKKNGDLIYAIAIEPVAYHQLLIRSGSEFGKQIQENLLAYAAFRVAPNLRKLLAETPVSTPMADFDPHTSEAPEEYEYIEPTEIESEPMFSAILVQLTKAVNTDQITKWKEWALKPKQASQFEEDYPSYSGDVETLATRHLQALAF